MTAAWDSTTQTQTAGMQLESIPEVVWN